MKRTPQQTYLTERLHSASGLGWHLQQTESAWSGLLGFIRTCWLRGASLHLFSRLRAAR